ncbi:MAG TPA: SIMPL domain-containing protein [Pyrinomonadaceae bacterium]|nr:SIMPL domain-containing protein [Pyrinomonadaceae bacterium]
MRKISWLTTWVLFSSMFVVAQESGNRAYSTPRRKPTVNSGALTAVPDGKTQVYFIEANVLMNMRADSYTAVLGVVQEAPTAAESNSKTDAAIGAFTRDLESLGIKHGDIFVDFITQNKVYDYTTSGTTVSEKFSGFETKKNVAIRYKDREMLEKILSAATKSAIYDLITVDYVVNDINAAHAKLYDEAVKVIKQKEAGYASSFGVKLTPTNVASEKYDAFYPGELYSNYQAYEAGNTYGDYNNRVVQARKTRTFFYEPLNPSDFDSVINQIGIEPVVQLTLYVKMQYDLASKK